MEKLKISGIKWLKIMRVFVSIVLVLSSCFSIISLKNGNLKISFLFDVIEFIFIVLYLSLMLISFSLSNKEKELNKKNNEKRQ